MKRHLTALVCCLSVLLCLTVAFAEDTSRSYLFALSVDGEDIHRADPGDVITVTFHLCRTDSSDAHLMYGMQNEISYDTAFFAPVEGSVLCGESIATTCVSQRDGTERRYMNFLSLTGGEEWPAERLVGSFQLRVIATEGTAVITNENCLVSTSNGRDVYRARTRDVTVTLSGDDPAEGLVTPSDPVTAPARRPLVMGLFALLAAALLMWHGRKRAGRK